MQCFAHHGLRQAYSKEKEKAATYILVLMTMISQDSMHVQHIGLLYKLPLFLFIWCMPDEARNHPTINSSMPNNFHTIPVAILTHRIL